MARTEGSGWGGGPLFYQVCPKCGHKKVYYDPVTNCNPFKCTSCKERFNSETLVRLRFKSQIKPKEMKTRIEKVGLLTIEMPESAKRKKRNGAAYLRRLVKWLDARQEYLNDDKSHLDLIVEFNLEHRLKT